MFGRTDGWEESRGAGGGHGPWEPHHPRMMRPGRHAAGMFAGRLGFGRGLHFLLKPALLLLLAERPMHGYELVSRLKELGIGRADMDPSLVYRILRLMEETGVASSSLDDSGAGPARKVYRLTPDGMEMLDIWAANLDEILASLEELRERYRRLERKGER